MGRHACLFVPRFAVAAQLRAEPELRGCPLVVCDASTRATVVDVSREAHRVGARPGLTVAQALIRHADLVVRPLDVAALEAAQAALVEVGRSVSPRIEIVGAIAGARPSTARSGSGEILIDLAGLEQLFGSPAGIAAALLRRAERVGFAAGVGIADGRATARIAAGMALRCGEAVLVGPGEDATWLAPLPLAALDRARDASCAEADENRRGWSAVVDRLGRLGVGTLGDFAAMPVDEIASRLGKIAAQMWHLAAGRDRTPLRSCSVPQEYVEGTRLEYGVTSIEALLFLVRGLLDRIMSRLALASLSCSGLTAAFTLEDGSRTERAVGVLAPTRDVKTLTMLVRTAIEAAPPPAAIEAVQLTALPDRARADQLDLFRPAGPPPAQLATTLARLAAMCGDRKVGRAVPPPGHRPDAFGLVPFVTSASNGMHSSAVPRARQPTAGAVTAPDPADEAAPPLVGSCATLALRAIRPPRVAQVFLSGGRITYVRAAGLGGRAVVTSGPWRIDAEWWCESPCRRDYYDVQLSDGGVYRLFRDLAATGAQSSWFVDGCYD
jgi:protein ImuB